MKALIYSFFLICPLLSQAQKIELVVPKYHQSTVVALDLSPDHQFLLTAEREGIIFLREASTGNFLKDIIEKGSPRSIKFFNDSRRFLIQTSTRVVIRDIGKTEFRQTMEGEFRSVRVNPIKNEWLATTDSTLVIYTEVNGIFKIIKTVSVKGPLHQCDYSEDGQLIIFNEGTVNIFDPISGKVSAAEMAGMPSDSIQSLALHKNHSTIAIGLTNGMVKLFDLAKGQWLDSLRLYQSYWSARFSKGIIKDSVEIRYPVRRLFFTNDGNLIGHYSKIGALDDPILKPGSEYMDPDDLDRMWDQLQHDLDGRKNFPTQLLALWNINQKKSIHLEQNTDEEFPFAIRQEFIAFKAGQVNYLTGDRSIYEVTNTKITDARFSADSKKLLINVNNNIWIWNLATGNNSLLHYPLLTYDHLDTYQNLIGVETTYYPQGPGFFNMDAGKLDSVYHLNGHRITINPYKTQSSFLDDHSELRVVDFSSGRQLYHEYDSNSRYSYSFSEDGKFFVSGNKLLNTVDYSLIDSIPNVISMECSLQPQHNRMFMTDRNTLIIRDYSNHVNKDTLTFSRGNSQEIFIDTHFRSSYDLREDSLNSIHIFQAEVAPDGKSMAIAFESGAILIIDPTDYHVIKKLYPGQGRIQSLDYSSDNRLLETVGDDGSLFVWDLKTYEILARVFFFGKDWVVVNPDRLFDGSPGGLARLFFINGLQTIELSQLKTRYYEPGLLKKITNGEKLRNVVGFNKVELPPEIRVGQVDSKGNLPIEVINRGGGIGEVALFINGKEVIKDLRKPGTESKGASLSFSVPVSSNKSLVAGTENFLAIKAWNAGQWIESRGTIVKYTPPSKKEIEPKVFILACGVSDYTGNEIDLKYAAKDAQEIAKAMDLGAKRLFGASKTTLYSLTTGQGDQAPTKNNLIKTFEKIAAAASASDVLVVYLSGHGINLGGTEGDFYYLTQDAYTANPGAYQDPAIKKQTTVSSQELVELFKTVAALKQVLIIDACASGKVVDNLMARRDIESGTLRALDRMKDRTGMHIITGCTADAVSYEASRYGQGVLTYSLLEGLRGLALREERFVDVSQLFQFAQERVPVLASGIGGIQTPQVFSPNGSQSFDFGELTSEDKKQIIVAKERPVYIRSTFIDQQKFRDVLGLGKKMDTRLNDTSTKGESSPLLFSDVSEYPDGCQLSGEYKQTPGLISLRLNRTCEGKDVLFNLEAKDEKELLDKIMDILSK